jgi:hypothetical protein
MAERTQNLADFAGSIPPLPVPEGTTAREEAAARWLNDAHRGYWGWEDAIGDAQDFLAAVDGPPPDWSDLREMARNAGWRCRTEPVGLRPVETKVWAHYPLGDRYPDGSRGWARVAYGRDGACRMSVEMHAPGRDPRSRVDLVDPSPAEVLTAARLLGLVGGVS